MAELGIAACSTYTLHPQRTKLKRQMEQAMDTRETEANNTTHALVRTDTDEDREGQVCARLAQCRGPSCRRERRLTLPAGDIHRLEQTAERWAESPADLRRVARLWPPHARRRRDWGA